jgi:hypothetical protein
MPRKRQKQPSPQQKPNGGETTSDEHSPRTWHALGDGERSYWLEHHSLVPLLEGRRPPKATSFEEHPFCCFAQAAEVFHRRSIAEDLASIERELNGHGLTIADLFPWAAMLWEIKTLGEWHASKAPRGRRPKIDLRRDVDALARLINSAAVVIEMKPWLVAEHARLARLLPRAEASLPLPPWPLRPISIALKDIPSIIKRVERRDPKGPPSEWSKLIRAAHAQLLDLGRGLPNARALKLLCDLLLMLFPAWWAPDGAGKRLRALVNYRPANTIIGRAMNDHLRQWRERFDDEDLRDTMTLPQISDTS